MTKNAAAVAKSKEVKAAAKRVAAKLTDAARPDPEHGMPPSPEASAFGAFAQSQLGGVDSSSSGVVESSSGNVAGTTDEGTTMTKQEKDAAAAQAKIAEKEAKQKAAAEKKAAAEAEKKAKAEQKAAEAAKRAEAGIKESTESMRALAERVKSGTYVKGRNGQLRSSDPLALALESVAVDKMVTFLLAVLGLNENPYTALNYGQQSMSLRNRLRGAIRKGVEINGEKLTVEAVVAKRDAMNVAYVPPAPKAKADPKEPAKTEVKVEVKPEAEEQPA